MFLTLDSARKLLAIAFCMTLIVIVLAIDTVVWAQITPVPGGVSSIDNKLSLSSSTSGSKSNASAPSIERKSNRPLLALRPDAELPPVPPAAVAGQSAPAKDAVGVSPAPQPQPTAGKGSAADGPAPMASAQTAKEKTVASPTASAQEPPPGDTAQDKFMLDLESDLAGTVPVAAIELATAQVIAAKNSALNPAASKSFVVQASATGEVPPVPPAPATPAPAAPTPRPLPAATSTTPAPQAVASAATSPEKSPAALPSPTTSAQVPTTVPTKAPPKDDEPLPKSEAVPANPSPDKATPANVKPSQPSPVAAGPVGPVLKLKGDPATKTPDAVPARPDTATYMHIGDQTPVTTGSTSSITPNPARSNPASANPIVKAKNTKPDQLAGLGSKMLESIEFDDVPLADAMKLFAEQAGVNVITSTEAGKTRVTVFLKQVTAQDALEAIVKANGLFYRVEAGSGIVRIATSKEYEKDLSSFREEQTRVFTLLYPNPIAVAQVIQQVFGSRVQMNRADADAEDLLDLSRRFNRFDMLDGRSLGLGGSNNGSGGGRNAGAGLAQNAMDSVVA